MTRNQRALTLAFALLGLGASAGSTYVHYQLLRDPTYTSFCDVSATVSCQKVYESAYATVQGVPVALAGLLWFALVLILAAFDRPVAASAPVATGAKGKSRKEAAAPAVVPADTPAYLFILSTAALAVVLYMAYASFVVLQTLCVLCALTYVAVVGIFLVSGAAGQSTMASLPGRLAHDLRRLLKNPVAATVAALYVIGAASAVAFFPRADGGSGSTASTSTEPTAAAAPAPPAQAAQVEQFEKFMSTAPRTPIMIPDDGAAVVVVKFNDYQCPPCRQTYMEYKPIFEKYKKEAPGKVKYVSKDFPLEAECNTGGVHEAGCEAAAAVRMARTKGKAEAMEDWLFANQQTMSPTLVRTGVKDVAGVNDFDAQYPKVLEQVKADVALGRQLGVGRTPTFFINGVKIEGGLRPQFLEAAIAYELKRTATAKQ